MCLTHENLDDNILLENCKKIVSNHRHSIVELSGTIDTALVIPGCLVYVLSACFWTSLDSITKNRGGKNTINYFYPYNILLFLFHYDSRFILVPSFRKASYIYKYPSCTPAADFLTVCLKLLGLMLFAWEFSTVLGCLSTVESYQESLRLSCFRS